MYELKLIFDVFLTSQHSRAPPPARETASLPPTHLKNNRILLSCPALTQFLLITSKVYIKAGQIYRRDATWQDTGKQDYP